VVGDPREQNGLCLNLKMELLVTLIGCAFSVNGEN